MIRTRNAGESPLVVVGTGTGVTLIPSPTQLTRLNYFDGKFLRAEDLSAEQDYLRSLVQLSNQAGGAGVVHGFDTRLGAGGALELGPGLAIDRAGRVLLLPHPTSVGVAELIERSRNPATGGGKGSPGKAGSAGFGGCAEATAGQPPATSVLPAELYLVVLAHAEALCGEEDVYGKLCEDACSPDTNRRFRVEGVVLRAVPVSLDPPTTPFPTGTRKHLRSLAASAYYATERARLGREMSGARLRSDLWCHPAPVEHWPVEAGEGVPLALLSVTGGVAEWLDAWTARRERIEAPPRKAWAWQMMMRPWEVFLAQVLQFQCQLHDVLTGGPQGPGGDPCEDSRRLLERARAVLERIERRYGGVPDAVEAQPAQPVRQVDQVAAPAAPPAAMAQAAASEGSARWVPQARDVGVVGSERKRVQQGARPEYLPELAELQKEILVALDEGAPGSARVLVDGGIVELPPAGYLAVVPGREVDEQVRQLLGDGVDLRFCAVRPDYVAHALEEAQHLDRIGLLQGLEDPAKRPEVDVLVPDGEVLERPLPPAGHLFEVVVRTAPRPQQPPPQAVETPSTAVPATGQVPGAASTGDEQEPEQGEDDDAEQGRTLLRGAGRSHALPGGGGAFHFAGVSGRLSRLEMPKTGYSDKAGYSSMLGKSGGTDTRDAAGMKRAAGSESAAGLGVPRIPGLGEAFGWVFGGAGGTRGAPADAADDADAAARPRSRVYDQVAAPSAVSLAQVTLGVWASLRCEGDPFALDVGESVPVRGEAVLAVDGLVVDGEAVPLSARVRLAGAELVCRVPADGGSRMRGRLQGLAVARSDSLAEAMGDGSGTTDGGEGTDGDGEEKQIALDVPVELELRPVIAGGSELVATLFVPTAAGPLAVTFSTSWRGAPILAKGVAAMDLLRTIREQLRTATGAKRTMLEEALRRIDTGALPATLPVLLADARENPAVAEPANPYHADAVRALKAIARVLDDPGFRDASERLLFPPPPRQSGAARVRATRDWVLFHRRRRSSCDCCPGAAVAAPPRKYRVYHAALDDDPSPEEIREALASDDPPGDDLLQLLPLALEFEGGATTLLTPRGELLDAWRDAGPAPALLYGAIAPAGAGTGDSDALLDGRLDRIVAAVETETPEYPGAAFDVLGRVPSWLPAGAADGVVILLSTRAGAATECQEVFLVRMSENTRVPMATFLRQGGTRDDLQAFADRVGEVRYRAGTTDAVDGSLEAIEEAWGAKEPGLARSAFYLTPATESQPELRDRHEERARGVLEALGLDDGVDQAVFTPGVTECDSVLLVVTGSDPGVGTETVLHRVVEVDTPDMLARLAKAMTAGQGNAVYPQAGGRELGYVRFAGGTSSAEQPTLDAVREESTGGTGATMMATPQDATTVQVAQGVVIQEALEIGDPPTAFEAPLAGNQDVYGNAQIVTLVVAG